MKTFLVNIPITGVLQKVVYAGTEDEAVDMAFEEATIDDLEEWDSVSQIVTGNVFSGILNKYNVQEINK